MCIPLLYIPLADNCIEYILPFSSGVRCQTEGRHFCLKKKAGVDGRAHSKQAVTWGACERLTWGGETVPNSFYTSLGGDRNTMGPLEGHLAQSPSAQEALEKLTEAR